jgi:hypothetical protein
MATVETRLAHDPVDAAQGESLADRGLPLVAMVGAVGGAIGGAALGAEIGTAFPLAFGTLGTMLGSGAAAGGWCLLTRAWARLFTTNTIRHPIHSGPVAAPVPRLG